MKVPDSWWVHSGSSGNELHPGKIHSINFEQTKNRIFQLQLDDVDEPDLHPMRYDAVLAYADETCPSYSSFGLPAQFIPNPVNEIATSTPRTNSENCKEYIKTNPKNWTVLKDGKDGRTIDPIPYTGESGEF